MMNWSLNTCHCINCAPGLLQLLVCYSMFLWSGWLQLRPRTERCGFHCMYVISYIGGGLLIRYAEGAAYLAIIQVRNTTSQGCAIEISNINYAFNSSWKGLSGDILILHYMWLLKILHLIFISSHAVAGDTSWSSVLEFISRGWLRYTLLPTKCW